MPRLIQLQHPVHGRRAARVQEHTLAVLCRFTSTYALVEAALERNVTLESFVSEAAIAEHLDYDPIYEGRTDWRILPPFDHPAEPARCRVTGTGLTHMRSAEARSSMHSDDASEGNATSETDSMRMYRLGVEGGRPAAGQIGVAPEWFHKGDGSTVRAHGESVTIPPFAYDGGEEAEVAGIYIVDSKGQPRRVGFAIGNEFSDHVFERQNYLYLAHSKLRECAVGPELIINNAFEYITGEVQIERGSEIIWRKNIATGEKRMSHSLANLEHHHFKYDGHRRPGDVHIHFFGADALSSQDGVKLKDGDVVQIAFENFGRPLRNSVREDTAAPALVVAHPV